MKDYSGTRSVCWDPRCMYFIVSLEFSRGKAGTNTEKFVSAILEKFELGAVALGNCAQQNSLVNIDLLPSIPNSLQ